MRAPARRLMTPSQCARATPAIGRRPAGGGEGRQRPDSTLLDPGATRDNWVYNGLRRCARDPPASLFFRRAAVCIGVLCAEAARTRPLCGCARTRRRFFRARIYGRVGLGALLARPGSSGRGEGGDVGVPTGTGRCSRGDAVCCVMLG